MIIIKLLGAEFKKGNGLTTTTSLNFSKGGGGLVKEAAISLRFGFC